jgi:hypothetical protein
MIISIFVLLILRRDGYLHLLGGSDGSQDGEDSGDVELHFDGLVCEVGLRWKSLVWFG